MLCSTATFRNSCAPSSLYPPCSCSFSSSTMIRTAFTNAMIASCSSSFATGTLSPADSGCFMLLFGVVINERLQGADVRLRVLDGAELACQLDVELRDSAGELSGVKLCCGCHFVCSFRLYCLTARRMYCVYCR